MKVLPVFQSYILIAALLLGSCAKHCEEFNRDILKWMPYKLDETIELNYKSGIETFSVNASTVSYTEKVSFGAKCACDNSYVVTLSSQNFNVNFWFEDSNNVSQSYAIVNGEVLVFDAIESGTTDKAIYKNSEVSSSLLIKELTLTKNIGISRIVMQNGEILIFPDEEKPGDLSGILMIKTNC